MHPFIGPEVTVICQANFKVPKKNRVGAHLTLSGTTTAVSFAKDPKPKSLLPAVAGHSVNGYASLKSQVRLLISAVVYTPQKGEI